MTIALLILAIIIGYLRKGRLKNFANLQIKLVPLIMFAFIIQIGIYFGYKYDVEVIQSYDIVLHFVSYIILFAGLMGNLDNKWFIVITLGVVCNFMVIFLNGGKMPVSFEAASVIGISVDNMNALINARAGTHQGLEAGALLWFFSDVLPIRFPAPLNFFNNIYSVGDFVIYLGMVGLIQSSMVQHPEEEYEEMDHEELPPVRVFDSFHAENHMDDMYMNDHDTAVLKDYEGNSQPQEYSSTPSNEETVIVNLHNDNSSTIMNQSMVLAIEDDQEKDIQTGNQIEAIEERIEDKIEEIETEETQETEEIQETYYETAIESDVVEKEEVSDEMKNENMDELVASKGELTFEQNEPEEIQNGMNFEADYHESELEEFNDIDRDVDTAHQFIIVDGKIKENPYYNKNMNVNETTTNDNKNPVSEVEDKVMELEMTQVDLDPKSYIEEKNIEQHLLQKITDSERVDLMKKMKQRQEKGYTLVEVEVGTKKINFWKKDL